MKKIITLSILLLVMVFSQAIYKGGEVRLSPRLLNYQGYLTDTLGNPITNPSVSMVFSIYDAASVGNQKWSETQSTISVSKGIFSVLLGSITPIPDSVFATSTNRWLALTVAGQVLSPRTRIVSSAYAITSTYADTAVYARNSVPDNDWTYRITNAADTTLQTGGQWGLARAGDVLLGNADSTHVNFGVACTTGAAGQNYKFCTVGGGFLNLAGNEYASAAGGTSNRASGYAGTVGGGIGNIVSGYIAAAGGGFGNTASGNYATVGGGLSNTASGVLAIMTGGYNNMASGGSSVVVGGEFDTASAYIATICGGRFNKANNFGAFVGGGESNIASGTDASVGGGANNTAGNFGASVGGGRDNSASFDYATVAGGRADTAKALWSGVGSGYSNLAGDNEADTASAVAGGRDNSALARFSYVGGGISNTANGDYATIGGGMNNTASDLSTTVGGGMNNTASDYRATVSGGWDNTASMDYTTVSGGWNNNATAFAATVAGGIYDSSAADHSFTANSYSKVPAGFIYSTALNGMTALSAGQTRVSMISKSSGTFSIDHPLDPEHKILNHYFVESPEMVLIYRGIATIGDDGRSEVQLPDYFDALNENPQIQLTGVGTYEVFIAANVKNNSFVIGGKPGTEVHWTVTGARKDPSAEITEILMPVEQVKEGGLVGRSLDDEFLVTTMAQLERLGKSAGFKFRHASEQKRYEEMRTLLEKNK